MSEPICLNRCQLLVPSLGPLMGDEFIGLFLGINTVIIRNGAASLAWIGSIPGSTRWSIVSYEL